MFDVVTIGSATQDIFIESDLGKIQELRDPYSSYSMLCFEYGAKIEIDQLAYDIGGGAVNTAVNFANLGFKTAPIIKLGYDLNAKAIFQRLEEKTIDKSTVIQTKKFKTGFSVILTSFEGDRTVLAHRGANSKLNIEEIPWEEIKNSKWIYIAPLSGDSNLVLDKVAEFAEENGVSMAFNPGSTQIKRGIEDLKKIICTAEVLVMNKSEAASITGTCMESKEEEGMEKSCKIDINEMLYKLKSYGPKVVVITEGGKGMHCYDGEKVYFAPPFPAKTVSTLGAGDAFASTFVGGLIRYNWDIEKAIRIASINASQVIQNFGAQSGLKNFLELEEILSQNADYKISIYTK
jgi:ribokinase